MGKGANKGQNAQPKISDCEIERDVFEAKKSEANFTIEFMTGSKQ